MGGLVTITLLAFQLACTCGMARAAAPAKPVSHGCHGDVPGDSSVPAKRSERGCAHCRVAMTPVSDHATSAPPPVWSLAVAALPDHPIARLDGSPRPCDPAARAPARTLLRLKCVLLA